MEHGLDFERRDQVAVLTSLQGINRMIRTLVKESEKSDFEIAPFRSNVIKVIIPNSSLAQNVDLSEEYTKSHLKIYVLNTV